MDKVIVHIGNKTYNCQLAKTEEEHRKGLMDVEYLAPDEKPLSGTYMKSPLTIIRVTRYMAHYPLLPPHKKLAKKHSFKK